MPATDASTLLTARLADLGTALAAGGDRLPSDAVSQARELLDRIGERMRLGADRTVVAFVGATGSGKSSLFNALAGIELAEVSVRRPTTAAAGACVWAAEGADPLLDWLDVPRRQRTNRQSVLDGTRQDDLHGLVLLDLPDHDSTVVAHKIEVDRLVELVDLLIWVVDPQKYADEALHAYLRKLGAYAGVMLVVLNQMDTLNAAEAETCSGDLRRLLDADGLSSVAILTTSARNSTGVLELRALLADLVARRGAFAGRALADVESVAAELRSGVAATEPDPSALPGSGALVGALEDAVGVPAVLDRVTADYRRRAAARMSWPPVLWWDRLRPDPLTKLGLDEAEAEQVRALAVTAPPQVTPAQRDRVQLAVREVQDASASGLPGPWSQAVHGATVAAADELTASLDDAVSAVDLELRPPAWWTLVGLVNALAVVAGAVGLVWWIASLAGAPAPDAGGSPLPLLLLVAGLGVSVVLTLGGLWLGRIGATGRRNRVAEQLRAVVSAVVVEKVVAPVAAVLVDHRTTRQALAGSR